MAGTLVINTVTLDKSSYSPGDTMTATVTYTQTMTTTGQGPQTYVLTVTATDTANGTFTQKTEAFTVGFPSGAVPDPVAPSGSDNRPSPGAWAVTSNEMDQDGNGSAVLTSTA